MGEEEVAAAAVAALFASRPRSFRMDRRSPEAANLKAAISRKLVDFLGNYTDDVLAEYIVVLVCNGKHQNQARDDLEAFLGDDSEKFIAWLWHYLSEEASLLKIPTSISDQKTDAVAVHSDDFGKEQKNAVLTKFDIESIRTSNIPLPKDGKSGSLSNASVLSSSCGLKVSDYLEDVPRRSVELANCELRDHVCQIDGSSGPNNRKNSDSLSYKSTRGHSLEAPVGNEQSLQLEDSYLKTGCRRSNDASCESPKKEPNTRNLRSVLTGDSHLRHQSLTKVAAGSLSPDSTDSVSHQNKHPRGSVWDRLGKPHEDTNVLMNERFHQHGVDVIKRRKLDHSGEGFDKHRLASHLSSRLGKRAFGETTSVENSHVSPISGNVAAEHREINIYNMDANRDTVYSKKKKHFGSKDANNRLTALSDQRDGHLEDEKSRQKLQRSLAASDIPKQSVKQATAENSIPSEIAQNLLKSVKGLHNFRPNEVSQLQARMKLSVPTSDQEPAPVDRSVRTKVNSLGDTDHTAASHKPVEDEVLNVKQRLHQIEREMLELRSKQTNTNTDSKAMASQVSGLRNYPEEDADVRTVFVTNVHFAAPKEALSSHFSQCGPIVRVVLLTDPISGQPKGSAYIVFASKESADKATALSNKSFFSRTLKVMRKADVPAGTLSPNQATGKPPRPLPWFAPQTHGKNPFQRQVSGHLQWRRDQASGGTGDSSISGTTTDRLEASDSA